MLAAVVFSVVFEDLDPAGAPSTWISHLHNLRHDELEVPALMHALDKATGIISLLEEVTFDLSTKVISCHFVDGSVEQLSLVKDQCITALEQVVSDVNESSAAIERELEEEKQRALELERKRFEAPLPPLPQRVSRHKKQKSLLMTLVASIIPLYTPSTNSRLPSPPPTPISEKKPGPSISPRNRRRKARSALVDTFRRYVLSELSQRFPHGGYTTWILQSMLRRTTEAMRYLVKEAGGTTSTCSSFLQHPDESAFFSLTAEPLPPTPSASDDEGETISTISDGSSIHTPTSAQEQFPPLPMKRHNYVSRSPRRLLSDSNYALYAQHSAQAGRLRRLAMIDRDRQEQEAADLQHHHHLLEIRSRRRAWLNRTLYGGVRSQDVDSTMSVVFESSPLAQNSWTADDYDSVSEDSDTPQESQEYEEFDKVQLRMKRSQRFMMGPKLFPVSEEEDDDDAKVAFLDSRGLELGLEDFDIDLESGMRGNISIESMDEQTISGIPIALEIERPQLRPRVRTNSMYKHRLRVPPRHGFDAEPPSSPQLTASSLLCQPLTCIGQVSSQDDLSRPPVYTEVDVDFNVSQVDLTGYGGFDRYTEDEFTLSMDLPISVPHHTSGTLANKRRFSFKSERNWFSSRLSPPPGLEDLLCR
ncbi:hypothetical protein H0H93_016251 [Arthromyces matolae]|nr:hypothetical protein H0H93_016251 [Arthromyces matolae]